MRLLDGLRARQIPVRLTGDVSHPDHLLDFVHDEPPYSALEHFDLKVGPPEEAFTLKIKGWHEQLFVGHAAACILIDLPSARMPHDFLRYRTGLLLILRLLDPELAFSSQDFYGHFSVARLGSPDLLFIRRSWLVPESIDWSAFYDHADCGAHFWVCSPRRLGNGTLAEQEDWLGELDAVDHTLSDVLSRLEYRHDHALVPLMAQLRGTGERLGW
ncbi:hypothetical protein [Deinococcus aquaedulcis]|uniref:hypothetical protein n=1 Tax=Deinococcus aquaedulcis TaxID=2840455 RepID=UPI001C830B29|nr:hypothetical protein [Deinococcus aquaedulcis]